jgi:hypothetical protein
LLKPEEWLTAPVIQIWMLWVNIRNNCGS